MHWRLPFYNDPFTSLASPDSTFVSSSCDIHLCVIQPTSHKAPSYFKLRTEPWYLEKVQVTRMTGSPPLLWEATSRSWISPAPQLQPTQPTLTQILIPTANLNQTPSSPQPFSFQPHPALASSAGPMGPKYPSQTQTQDPTQTTHYHPLVSAVLTAVDIGDGSCGAAVDLMVEGDTDLEGGSGGAVAASTASAVGAVAGIWQVELQPDPMCWEAWDLQVCGSWVGLRNQTCAQTVRTVPFSQGRTRDFRSLRWTVSA